MFRTLWLQCKNYLQHVYTVFLQNSVENVSVICKQHNDRSQPLFLIAASDHYNISLFLCIEFEAVRDFSTNF